MRHRKFLRLVTALGGDEARARGTLELLWDAGYESGDPIVGDATAVELLVRWKGRRGAGAAALVAAGFLDLTATEEYAIHDLMDHAPDYVRKRAAREDARRRRTADTDRSLSASDVSGTQVGGVTPAPAPAPALAPAPAPAPEERGARAHTRDDDSPVWGHRRAGAGQRSDGLVSTHPRCDPATFEACNRGLCVPAFLAQQWRAQLGAAAGADGVIRGVVRDVLASLPDGPVGDDPLKFWRAHWQARHGTQAPTTITGKGTDSRDAMAQVLEERARRRASEASS